MPIPPTTSRRVFLSPVDPHFSWLTLPPSPYCLTDKLPSYSSTILLSNYRPTPSHSFTPVHHASFSTSCLQIFTTSVHWADLRLVLANSLLLYISLPFEMHFIPVYQSHCWLDSFLYINVRLLEGRHVGSRALGVRLLGSHHSWQREWSGQQHQQQQQQTRHKHHVLATVAGVGAGIALWMNYNYKNGIYLFLIRYVALYWTTIPLCNELDYCHTHNLKI